MFCLMRERPPHNDRELDVFQEFVEIAALIRHDILVEERVVRFERNGRASFPAFEQLNRGGFPRVVRVFLFSCVRIYFFAPSTTIFS